MDKFVWVRDEVRVFAKAKVIKNYSAAKKYRTTKTSVDISAPNKAAQEENKKFGMVSKLDESKEYEIAADEVFKFDSTHDTAVADLAAVSNLNEPAVLNILKLRFQSDSIYTKVEPLIISINPYKNIPYLYDIGRYETLSKPQREAHVYNIGRTAMSGCIERMQNQSVAVSGESGAGKTEACKQLISYIMKSTSSSSPTSSQVGDVLNNIEAKLAACNPIIEVV